jgi:thiamine-phosphate pyrophosphorylase
MAARLQRPLVCLVTDRHRLGAASEAAARAALLELIAAAGAAGVDLVQIRERDLSARDLAELTRRSLEVLAGTPTRLVVNDRLDVARAVGAHGVHLRADGIDAARARQLAPPPFLIGRSVHSAEEAGRVAAAGGLDYLILGTVFPSASKGGGPAVGVVELARAVAAVSVPVLAIGGVTLATVEQIAAVGAGGVAAIGLFANGPRSAAQLADVVARVRRAFDTPRSVV